MKLNARNNSRTLDALFAGQRGRLPSTLHLICMLLLLATSCPAGAAEAPLEAGPDFLIGVWYQPVSNFDKWKARGINTLVGCPENAENVSRENWMATAKKAGFNYIAKPTDDADDIKSDLADKNLIAWEQPDEPDGAGNVPADKILENYKTWKALGNKPILLNLDGARFQFSKPEDYTRYCEGADWLAFDFYIINRGDGPENIKKIGDAIDRLKKWSGGQKKIFVFIECSDQDLRISDFGQLKGADGQPIGTKMRGPTADEMKAEIDIAMKHGAAGIIYFPQVIGKGWGGFDGTTPAVEAAMKEANAKLKADAEKAAAKPKAGIGDPATPTAKPRASLEGTDITIDGVTYTLVLKE